MRDRKYILDMARTPFGRRMLGHIGAEWPSGNETPAELDAMWERNRERLESLRRDLRMTRRLRTLNRLH